MENKIFYNSKHEYVKTTDTFIVRTKSFVSLQEVFRFSGLDFNALDIQNQDFYPEANVTVVCLNGTDHTEFIANLKKTIKEKPHAELDYIGSVLMHRQTGIYQIYTGNIILNFVSNKARELHYEAILEKYGLEEKATITIQVNNYFLEFTDSIDSSIFEKCQEISNEEAVDLCYPELIIQRRSFPKMEKSSDRKLNPNWVSEMINLDKAWETTKGENITICIIDDGIDEDHPAFSRKGKIIASRDMLNRGESAGHKFVNEYHGTAVCGVASSEDEQALGIAPSSNIIAIRCKGLGSVHEAEAIVWAADQGADIICCSWGPPDANLLTRSETEHRFPIPDLTARAIDYALENGRNKKGCLIFFAAGNGRESIINDGYAGYEGVMAIGSVNKEKRLSYYSDRGYPLFACFPSSEIRLNTEKDSFTIDYGLTTTDRLGDDGFVPGDYYYDFGGTSASAPGMAGAAALMLSVNNELSIREAKSILKKSCLLPNGQTTEIPDETYGWGIVDAELLIKNTIKQKIKLMTNENKTRKYYAIHMGIDQVDKSHYGNSFATLSGCVNDTNRYISMTEGYEDRTFLINDKATRSEFRKAFEKYIDLAKSGDIVVISYAGHGSTIEDEDGDEIDDQTDETLVLYDGIWIDDETKNLMSKFVEGVNVLWISDSCHSGTNSRGLQEAVEPPSEDTIFRYVDPNIIAEVYENNKAFYLKEFSQIEVRGSALAELVIQANVITLAACQDDEFAQERFSKGMFTSGLFEALENSSSSSKIQGIFEYALAYVDEKRNKRHAQTPKTEAYGSNVESMLNLGIGEIFIAFAAKNEVTSPNFKVETKKSPPPVKAPVDRTISTLATDFLYVETEKTQIKEAPTRGKLSAVENMVDQSIVRRSKSSGNAWDNAYQLMMHYDTEDNQIEFVEPDLISTVNVDEATENLRSKIEIKPDDYLHTYPHPSYADNTRFAWHLRDKFSELSKAFKDACVEAGDSTLPLTKSDFPLVAMIDTGVLEAHPSLPLHFEPHLSRNFTQFVSAKNQNNFEDTDNSLIPKGVEQPGHGHATMSLLAGKGFQTSLEDNREGGPWSDTMPKYIGAFPFARMMSIKISESVVMLNAKGFARAMQYIIVNTETLVVSMSMAGLPSRRMAKRVNAAYNKGIVLVSAAGNSWSKKAKKVLPKSMMYPARFERVIAATGITCNFEPYLNRFHADNDEENTMEIRATGGFTMQSCYGPTRLMKYSVAAYTPNVFWIDTTEGEKPYKRTGGGTSSATPQVAATAALYLHKHREWFAKNIKADKDLWKRAEIVRQAIFHSASMENIPSGFQKYFGPGALKAFQALQIHPADILKLIKRPAPEAKVGRFALLNLAKMFSTDLRSSLKKSKNDTRLAEMMSLEIEQLLISYENLSQYEESNELSDDFIKAILKCPGASKFLKNQLSTELQDDEIEGVRASGTSMKPILRSSTDMGDFKVWCNNTPKEAENLDISDEEKSMGITSKMKISFDEVGLRSGSTRLGYSYNTQEDHAVLAYAQMEDGTFNANWVFPDEQSEEVSTRSSRQANLYLGQNEKLIFINEEGPVGTRGLGKWLSKLSGKIKEVVISIVKTALDKPIADKEGLVFAKIDKDTDMPEWSSKPHSATAKTLLLLHGTWSQTDVSFKDLLQNKEFKKHVIKNFGGRLAAFEMSTIRSGIAKNADKLLSDLSKAKVSIDKLSVIAASRGCSVARKAFAKHPKLKIVMSAGTNLGTPLADKSNIKKLLNRVTNLSLLYTGPGGAYISGILKVVGFVTAGIYSLPGISDQAPESKFLSELDKTWKYNTNHLLIGANYEPGKWKFVRDEAIDRVIFANFENDGVVPLLSSLVTEGAARSDAKTHFITNSNIHHFSYYTDQTVIDKVIEHLK